MIRNNLPKYLIWGAIGLYVAFVGLFALKIAIDGLRKPRILSSSSIPSLLVEELEKVNAMLRDRKKLEYPAKIDVSQFEFGKTEPFAK